MDKRYFKRMARYWDKCHSSATSSLRSLNWEGWFDLWHMHYDIKAKGNRRENRPYSHFLGYELLKVVEQYCSKRTRPSQCFLCVYPDAMNDAVYIHTENPNQNSVGFPCKMADVTWGSTDNLLLNSIVNTETHQIGKVESGECHYYVVIKK